MLPVLLSGKMGGVTNLQPYSWSAEVVPSTKTSPTTIPVRTGQGRTG